MHMSLRKRLQLPLLRRFDQLVLVVWIVGIATSVCGYVLIFLFRNLVFADAVFWRVLWFVGFSIATFAHIGITYYGVQLTKTIKHRYDRYFDVLYEQDVGRIAQFIELTSDTDIVQMFHTFKLYRFLGIASVVLFACNVVIGRFVVPNILR